MKVQGKISFLFYRFSLCVWSQTHNIERKENSLTLGLGGD